MPITACCSHCDNRLRLADHLLGKRVKCPKCGEVFAVAAERAASVTGKDSRVAAGAPPRTPAKKRIPTEQEARTRPSRRDDDDEAPRSQRRPRKKQANNNLMVSLCIGGGIFLVGCIAIAFWLLTSSSQQTDIPVVVRAAAPEGARPLQIVQQPEAPVAQGQVQNMQPVFQPAPTTDPVNPAPIAPQSLTANVPPSEPSAPPQGLQRGARITVRPEIQGAPPSFAGDYNRHVAQNLEIALRQRGYEPTAQGGLILQVRATLVDSGKKISVRTIGAPLQPLTPRVKGRPVQPSPPPQNQNQIYPIEQVAASLVLLDAQGTALWKHDQKFTPSIHIFNTASPPREMQEQAWQMFDNWMRGNALATLKN